MFNEGSIKHKQWPKNYQGRSAKKDREDKNGFKQQTKKKFRGKCLLYLDTGRSTVSPPTTISL